MPREAVRSHARRLGPGVPQPGRRHGADRGGREGGRRGRGDFESKLAGARALVADAQANFDLLRAGRGAHNIEYALKIVRVGFEQVTAAFRMAGVTGGPTKPAILASPSAFCATLCHARVMPADKVFFKEMELLVPARPAREGRGDRVREVPLPEKHKMRIVTKSECMKCHHESKDIDCGHCHKAQQALYEGKVKAYGVTPAPDVMAAGKTKCISATT